MTVTARPSSFGSATYSSSPLDAPGARGCAGRRRVTSSSVKALSSDSIGTWCTTSPNAALGAPETRCVGESGVIEVRVRGLERAQLAASAGRTRRPGLPDHRARSSGSRAARAARATRRRAPRAAALSRRSRPEPSALAQVRDARWASSGPPCSSCSAPCRRSFRLRAVNTSSSKACGGGHRARAAPRTGSGRRSAASPWCPDRRCRAC